MMSRGIGLIAALLAMTVALAACDGGTGSTSAQTQATDASTQNSSPTTTPTQSNASTSAAESTALPLPCDAATAANTPCSAAHSVTRLLAKNYSGPLFQIQRASDNATQNIYPYTWSTLPNGADRALIGSANASSANAFCNNTSCSITYIYDQIDLVAPLKGGAFGNVAGTLTLNQNGTESLTVPNGGTGSQATTTVPVLNGFATITLPGTAGTLTVQLQQPPTALTTQSPTLQVSIGNDLPALAGTPAKLSFVQLHGTQVPVLATLAGQAYRNRFGTVNQSIGDTEIAE
jgi:non-reducing end alpha-L-arabinofuranosidase